MRQNSARPARGPIVILTGAGISKESGLDTFRDPGGVWSEVRIEDVATPQAFARDRARVHAFYNRRRGCIQDGAIRPNAAHYALVRLETLWPGGILLVTQNVDDLHDRAGSRNLIHMHGELAKVRCEEDGSVHPWTGDLDTASRCPACQKAGALRPHIVWFGEMPFEMEQIYDSLGTCALFVSIGTSGQVYPAAAFVAEATRGDAYAVELNLEPSANAALFDEAIAGPATEIVPRFVDELLSGAGVATRDESQG